ncbi:MAG: KEOPS complex kinase/ATPase Bud32 [Candidatus Bathyarchaeia archaeon]|jgi:Kae1-associated kinase Bud32
MLTSHGEPDLPLLIYTGAEAAIYLERWFGELAIRKHRIAKPYRIAELDQSIRQYRTSHEAIMLREVRKLSVPAPTILHVDPDSSTLIMDYVKGITLKEELGNISQSERRSRFSMLGARLASMHKGGIVHGDMTLSNVISRDGRLWMIDFGLGNLSTEVEDMGVDLLLLNRSLRSTHFKLHADLFRVFLKSYVSTIGPKRGLEIVEKMKEVESRGRYFERG